MLILAVLLLGPSPAEIRERAADPAPVEVSSVPGFDGSADGVRRGAEASCGTTDECLQAALAGRDLLGRFFQDFPSERSKIVRILQTETGAGLTNWRGAAFQYRASLAPARRELWAVTCRTFGGRRFSTTTCSSY